MAKPTAMIPVASSLISYVGHDHAKDLLYVKFPNGAVYEYQNVPQETFDAMLEAHSIGTFFSTRIKRYPGDFPFRKIK